MLQGSRDVEPVLQVPDSADPHDFTLQLHQLVQCKTTFIRMILSRLISKQQEKSQLQ
jgi:hypothetical protein